ncbi:class I SAM-dependent methyltransferase [Flexivirga alba]|uniref:Class I SAM-dependent methyltransferase n=1 Tax=Flexivirga alba TaxID=702742 RepID=A0ABW2AJH2_9MICO
MPDDKCDQADLDQRVLDYYGGDFDENGRLVGRSDQGVLEFERTQEFVTQRVPAGSRVLDVGGATGIHAAPLAARGDVVTLIDPVPSHVAAASQHGTFDAQVGDARSLPQSSESVDAVLLLGPLYHLAGRDDRLRAIREAVRVTRPGGYVFAGAISRTMAHVFSGSIAPARSPEPMQRSPYPPDLLQLLEDGSTEHLRKGFPGGHFHYSEELADELTEAGLVDVEVHGLEGPGGMPLEVDRIHDDELRAAAMLLARRFSDAPGLRDLSQHLLGIGRRP